MSHPHWTASDLRRRTWLWDVVACLLIVVASIAVVVVHVPKHDTVSPIDEYVYIDYYAKVLDQGIVHRGEETGEYAREYLACHGVRAIGDYPEALCPTEGKGRDAAYPNAGATSAGLYTPLYFAITRVLAQPLVWFGVELTDAGRAVGGLWLAAGVAAALPRVAPAIGQAGGSELGCLEPSRPSAPFRPTGRTPTSARMRRRSSRAR